MIADGFLIGFGLLSGILVIIGICLFVHHRRHNSGVKMTGNQRYGVLMPVIFGTIGLLLIATSPSLH